MCPSLLPYVRSPVSHSSKKQKSKYATAEQGSQKRKHASRHHEFKRKVTSKLQTTNWQCTNINSKWGYNNNLLATANCLFSAFNYKGIQRVCGLLTWSCLSGQHIQLKQAKQLPLFLSVLLFHLIAALAGGRELLDSWYCMREKKRTAMFLIEMALLHEARLRQK